MRRFDFLLFPAMLAMVLVTVAADGQQAVTFVGEWYGNLEIRPQRGSRNLSDWLNVRKLPTSLEITRAPDGTYSVRQISISQNNGLIPVTSVTVEGDAIRWSAPAANGVLRSYGLTKGA